MKLKLALLSFAILVCASLFTGCGRDGSGDTIRIASKPMTEQYILSEMLALLIEQQMGLKANLTQGVGGGTSNIHPAMVKGDFDLYPEYTGTAWLFVLKKDNFPDDQTLFRELTKEYAEKYHLEWVGMYGFNNTFGLAVHKDTADRLGLRTYSDLARHSNTLTFGAEYDFFERDDGYDALTKTYGMQFPKRVDMDMGLKHKALQQKQVDVITVSTTDGQLGLPEVVLLEDDKHFYRTYYCGTVVREEALERHPKLRETLMLMQGLISEEDMARLNHAVESEGRNEREVAREFLQSKNLLGS